MTSRVRLSGIGHNAVLTRDLDGLAAFYADAFGAIVGERSERDWSLGLGFIRVGDVTIHAFERSDGSLGGLPNGSGEQPMARGRIDHFSLEAADVGSFDTARLRLVELGATEGTVTDFGPLVSVFFTDPEDGGAAGRDGRTQQ
jgi:catechol 2,3-dioxygenase-like lactoylglutathione lyase family enzyme